MAHVVSLANKVKQAESMAETSRQLGLHLDRSLPIQTRLGGDQTDTVSTATRSTGGHG